VSKEALADLEAGLPRRRGGGGGWPISLIGSFISFPVI
jgi:hypothetical protein